LVVQFQPLQPHTKKQGSGANPNSLVDNLTLQPPPHANRQGSGTLLALFVCPSLDLRCGIWGNCYCCGGGGDKLIRRHSASLDSSFFLLLLYHARYGNGCESECGGL
jgi:hypothetical protein